MILFVSVSGYSFHFTSLHFTKQINSVSRLHFLQVLNAYMYNLNVCIHY